MARHLTRCAAAGALLCAAVAAHAAVTRVEIAKREPFAGGREFGATGAYERVTGRFYGELDPRAPLNRGIVDIARAPRNARGMVEYSAELDILKPVDLAKGNGSLIYDVNNRGNKRIIHLLDNTPASNTLDKPETAGDGFLFSHGFTIVWSGWIPNGLPPGGSLLHLEVPVAHGIKQMVWDEFLFNDNKQRFGNLSFMAEIDKPADRAKAQLTVRSRNQDTPSVIQPGAWEFIDSRAIRLLPSGTPFAIGQLYQLSYLAADPPVAGISYAATRDLIAYLRYQGDAANPLAVNGSPAIRVALAHGTSQSGRYLRDMVYEGFNEAENGKIVFDGINPHIASQKIFVNYRFSQANRLYSAGYGFLGYPDTSFPQAYETQPDPYGGKPDGILARCTARGNCPKIIHTNSATEYWQGGQSLVTTTDHGRRDGTPPANVRIYHLASSEHVITPTMPRGICTGPPNTVIDPRPVMRALFLALDRWVKDGTPPPPSRYPRIADGTLVAASELRFPSVAGLTPPRGPNPIEHFDYGPRISQAIIDRVPPLMHPGASQVLVPKVDADGNETGGVRVPELLVPIVTATGWALRTPEGGAAGELCYLDGMALPFAKTAAERDSARDPRPSLAERYASLDDYAAKLKAAAESLVREGYLLPEDAEHAVAKAQAMKW